MTYVILPVHNRKDITELFIKSLTKQLDKDFKLILIDDGSTDGTSDMVHSYIPDCVVLRGQGDLWWGGALHQGFLWIKENITDGNVLLINDDTVISEDFLQKGSDLLKHNENTLFLAQAYDKNNNHVDSGVHVDWENLTFNQAKNENEINCLSTRGLFLKVSDFLDIGGFHPTILPHYLSDYEFTIRAYNKGYKLRIDKDLKLVFDTEATGSHKIIFENYFNYLKKFFSKKYPNNPVYFTSFLMLACPRKYVVKNILRIFFRGIVRLVIPNYSRASK